MNEQPNDTARPTGNESGLPDTPPKPASSVRKQVREHMGKILMAAATAGALQTACTPPIVCDVLPQPPINCADSTSELVSQTHASAQWEQGSSGLIVSVSTFVPVPLTGSPVLDSGSLVDQTVDSGFLTGFRFTPAPGVTTVRATLPVVCDDGAAATVTLRMDLTGNHQAGTEIPVTVEP